MPNPIKSSSDQIDLSKRIFRTATVTGSPAAASETIIATLTLSSADLIQATGIYLEGWCAFTVGTNGTAATLKLRQTDTSGTTIKTSGATTVTAANLLEMSIKGLDTAGVIPGQVYVLTLTVTAGSAASTVSAVELWATVV